MRAALEDGARGIGQAPSEAFTQQIDPVTSATSIASPRRGGDGPTSIAPARRPREPRAAAAPASAAPRGRAAREARQAQRPRRRRRGALRRLMALLLTLVLVGAAAIAVITATSGQSDAVRLRRVVYDDVQRSVDAMKQLVEENTR
jgi:hypothetical protein